MQEIMYYLGIDGGGTKTEFILCDKKGDILNSCILDGCNPNDIGIEKCLEIIETGCREVCFSYPYNKISVFAGIAGALSGNISSKIISLFNHLGFSKTGCSSDTELSVALTTGINDGITVIMGTGIVVIVKKEGKQTILGGYNYFFDKGGSAFNIGRDAIQYAILSEERKSEYTPLYNSVLKKCNTTTVRHNLRNFYMYGKKYIAQFAECVTETFFSDKISQGIINNNMYHVAEMIDYALADFDTETDVYITGGLCCQKHIIEKSLLDNIKNKCSLNFITTKPVYGALKLAGQEDDLC